MSNNVMKLPVDHVSDTAFLVAMYRAMESESADAKFNDPYAGILAAPKAEWLKNVIPFNEEGRWMMTVRTCLLDAHILAAVRSGVDTVVNLAAGLDTRPYRLEVPESLRWIEADFPEITRYKTESLAAENPRCQLERITLDLADDHARRGLFAHVRNGAKRALVITEGLLPYLDEATVRRLAADLHAEATLTDWLMDVTSAGFMNRFRERFSRDAKETDVAMKFAPVGGAQFFHDQGWRVEAFASFLDASRKLGVQMPLSVQTSGADSESLEDSGVAHLKKA